MYLFYAEITEEITVYRYSPKRTLDYLRKKAARLSEPKILENSKTVIRSFARDGLMEDGNEELLKSEEFPLNIEKTCFMEFLVGQLRAACELLAHYLSPAMCSSLYASYECASLLFLFYFGNQYTIIGQQFYKAERVRQKC